MIFPEEVSEIQKRPSQWCCADAGVLPCAACGDRSILRCVRAVLTGIPAAAARFGPGFSGKSKWFHQVTFLIFLMARYFPNTLFYRI